MKTRYPLLYERNGLDINIHIQFIFEFQELNNTKLVLSTIFDTGKKWR